MNPQIKRSLYIVGALLVYVLLLWIGGINFNTRGGESAYFFGVGVVIAFTVWLMTSDDL